MKNENCSSDMVDMKTTQEYLGECYPSDHRVASGGDHLTCEHQLGAQRLERLESQMEDRHCLVCMLEVSRQLQ